MIGEYTISVFRGVHPKVRSRKTINEILYKIRTDYKKETIKLRAFHPEQKEDRDKYKKDLEAVTFSGEFDERRKKDKLIKYNPLIVLDIDKLDLETLLEHKQRLINDIYVYASWMSPSGTGLKGLVPIEYDGLPNDYTDIEAKHKAAFKKLSEYLFESYNIELDSSGSDIPRLCFLSHDSDIHINNNCSLFYVGASDINLINHDRKKANNNSLVIDNIYSHIKIKQFQDVEKTKKHFYSLRRRKMQQIIKYLEKRKLSITEDYRSWIYTAFALSSTFPYDTAKMYYLRLCRLDGHKHDEVKSNMQFDSCYKNNKGYLHFRTIEFYAKQKGYYGGNREESTVMKVAP